jgi:uncharacterized membrane protein YtjA (UPF0391 family)
LGKYGNLVFCGLVAATAAAAVVVVVVALFLMGVDLFHDYPVVRK